jgi:hypothetical protein
MHTTHDIIVGHHCCVGMMSLPLLWPHYAMLICQHYVISYMNNEKVILCFRQWCSYGLMDYGCAINDPLKNKKLPNRERRKSGCQLHYIVRMVQDRRHLALIVYVEYRHVDKNCFPCHGHIDPTAEHQGWLHDMHLSKHVKNWVRSLVLLVFL